MGSGKLTASRVLSLIGLTVLGLWTTDILVNLRSFQAIFGPDPPLTRWLDFLGLLQAEVPLALLCMLGALSFVLLARLLPAAQSARDAVAALTAAIAFFTILSNVAAAWNMTLRWVLPAVLIVAGLVLVAVRGWMKRGADRGGMALAALLAILVPLLAGFVSQLVAGWLPGKRLAGWFPLFGLLGSIVFLFVGIRARSQASRWASAAALPGLALALAVAGSFSVRGYSAGSEASHRAASSRPGVVLIVLDTVRADHLALYGYPRDTMPLLEDWARQATVFRRAVSPAGWTIPAHASMFSGRSVSRHGIHYGREYFRTRAHNDVDWLPELLRSEGYRSMAVVANPLALHPDIAGFDQVVAPHRFGWQGATMAALFERHGVRNPLSDRLRWRLPYADARSIADIVMQAVPEGEAPAFLLVNFLDAHSPYNPPQGSLRRLGLGPSPSIPRNLGHRDLTRRWESLPEDAAGQLSNLYDAELHGLDRHLRRLLDWIERRFGEDCVVIVTSDHGEELGEEGRVGHEWGLAQRLIHVPLLIRGPGFEGGEIDAPVSLTSLFDLMWSAGKGNPVDASILTRPRPLGIVSERYPSRVNVRLLGEEYDRPWVAMLGAEGKGVGPSSQGFELYDISAEGFSREIALAPGSAPGELQGRIDAYWEEHMDRREESESEMLDDKERERLRSLGYVN